MAETYVPGDPVIPGKIYKAGPEEWIRDIARAYAADNPVIEKRTVTTTPWTTVTE